jgi:hypothetical protein
MTLDAQQYEELHELIGALCDGAIDTQRFARLQAMLAADLEAQRFYVRYLDIHSALGRLDVDAAAGHESPAASDSLSVPTQSEASFEDRLPVDAPRCTAPPVQHPSFISYPLSFVSSVPLAYIAVVLILGIGLLAVRNWPSGGALPRPASALSVASGTVPGPEATYVARVTGLSNSQWVNPNTTAREGEAIALGRRFVLRSGFLGITYASGARLLLAGPAVYEVDSPNGGILYLGKLGVTIQEKTNDRRGELGKEVDRKSEVKGRRLFCLRTPSSKMIARTAGEFRVEVFDSGGSSVYVREGKLAAGPVRGVEVARWKDDHLQPTVVYGAGEKGRFSSDAEEQRGKKSSSGT